jgi:hypothetical protein
MAGLQPGLEPLRRQRNRIRRGDADRVEAECLGALDESLLEREAF